MHSIINHLAAIYRNWIQETWGLIVLCGFLPLIQIESYNRIQISMIFIVFVLAYATAINRLYHVAHTLITGSRNSVKLQGVLFFFLALLIPSLWGISIARNIIGYEAFVVRFVTTAILLFANFLLLSTSFITYFVHLLLDGFGIGTSIIRALKMFANHLLISLGVQILAIAGFCIVFFLVLLINPIGGEYPQIRGIYIGASIATLIILPIVITTFTNVYANAKECHEHD